MVELGIGPTVARAVGWTLFAAIAVAVVVFVSTGKTRQRKIINASVVLLLYAVLFGPGLVSRTSYAIRLSHAQSLFEERCKSASEKIYRTVSEVEGVRLGNIRQRGTSAAVLSDPNWPDAGLPSELGQLAYIANFLAWEVEDFRNSHGSLTNQITKRPGYKFVDVSEPGNTISRYVLTPKALEGPVRTAATGDIARYVVSFTNEVNPEDRKYWIAGTTVKISDTQTGQLLAEKTWYSFDSGLGSTYGGRSPWSFAITCPPERGWSGASTRFFVQRVLIPKSGE